MGFSSSLQGETAHEALLARQDAELRLLGNPRFKSLPTISKMEENVPYPPSDDQITVRTEQRKPSQHF